MKFCLATSLIISCITVLIIKRSYSFSQDLHHGKKRKSFHSIFSVESKKSIKSEEEEETLVREGGVEYYKGLITSDSPRDNEKDNITPNLKLGGIMAGITLSLIASFMYINKDVPSFENTKLKIDSSQIISK